MRRFFLWLFAVMPGALVGLQGTWLALYPPTTPTAKLYALIAAIALAAAIIIGGVFVAYAQTKHEDNQEADTRKRILFDIRRRGWALYQQVFDLVFPVNSALFSIPNTSIGDDIAAREARDEKVREYYSVREGARTLFSHDCLTPLILLVEEVHEHLPADAEEARQKLHPGMTFEEIAAARDSLVNLLHKLENRLWGT